MVGAAVARRFCLWPMQASLESIEFSQIELA